MLLIYSLLDNQGGAVYQFDLLGGERKYVFDSKFSLKSNYYRNIIILVTK